MKGVAYYDEDVFTIKQDVDLYKENITRILLTSPGERVSNPSFGSRFKSFLFQLDFIMQEEVNNEVSKAIARWEPRVTVKAMRTSRPDVQTFHINLVIQINESLEEFDYEQIIKL
jgi:phage baseplate assembly protein W